MTQKDKRDQKGHSQHILWFICLQLLGILLCDTSFAQTNQLKRTWQGRKPFFSIASGEITSWYAPQDGSIGFEGSLLEVDVLLSIKRSDLLLGGRLQLYDGELSQHFLKQGLQEPNRHGFSSLDIGVGKFSFYLAKASWRWEVGFLAYRILKWEFHKDFELWPIHAHSPRTHLGATAPAQYIQFDGTSAMFLLPQTGLQWSKGPLTTSLQVSMLDWRGSSYRTKLSMALHLNSLKLLLENQYRKDEAKLSAGQGKQARSLSWLRQYWQGSLILEWDPTLLLQPTSEYRHLQILLKAGIRYRYTFQEHVRHVENITFQAGNRPLWQFCLGMTLGFHSR